MKNTYEFFLGGDDAEMREIKKIAISKGCIVHDKKLGWGAKASAYEEEMKRMHEYNQEMGYPVGVAVELEKDINFGSWHDSTWPLNCSCDFYAVDHHGSRAGEPPAIIQVCNILGIPPTREQSLIGAMDAGYAYGLEAIGATLDEIRIFLGATSAAKTVGEMLIEAERLLPEEIAIEAERAIENSEQIGDCIVVRCNHNKTAPITARLYDRQKKQNILILSTWQEDGEKKTEANYYGNGKDVRNIAKAIPGGWTGGAGLVLHAEDSVKFWTQFGGSAPDTAFWGISGKHHSNVLKTVLSIVD